MVREKQMIQDCSVSLSTSDCIAKNIFKKEKRKRKHIQKLNVSSQFNSFQCQNYYQVSK